MNPYLLDVAGAGFAFYAYGLIVLFMLLAVLLEAVVMILMKYNTRFKKAFLDSLFANVVTLAIGFMLLQTSLFYYGIANLLILYAITVAVEFGILYLLNKKKRVMQSLLVAFVMNVVSYLLFYAITGTEW